MSQSIALKGCTGAFALTGVYVLLVVANSWAQVAKPTQAPSSAKGTSSDSRIEPGDDDSLTTQDRLEVLEAQLQAKRTLVQIDASRVEQAKRWVAYYEKSLREGKVTEDRLLAAKDDILMMDSHLAAERAELRVAEIRVKYARRQANGDKTDAGSDIAKEALEELEAVLEAKRALIRAGESRAAQARRTEAHYEKLFRERTATEDLVLAAKDDVLHMDSLLAWAQADLKVAEVRVRSIRQSVTERGRKPSGASLRLAEMEERLALSEMRADLLAHEVGRLRRELPRETHGVR